MENLLNTGHEKIENGHLWGVLILFIIAKVISVLFSITKRITRSENLVWNKNTNRCKTGKADISSLL